MKKILALSFLSIFLISSCGSSKRAKKSSTKQPDREIVKPSPSLDIEGKTTKTTVNNNDNSTVLSPVEAYIQNYKEIAQEEMRLYGIPASIKIAQGILESGAGSGNLTSRSNNHFGIKCNGWTGEKVYHDDDEAQECFRKYSDARYSFRDHSLFLFERQRYAFLFDYEQNDYKSWARGLRKAGYATDPKYPEKLISLIERYQLYNYDSQTKDKPKKPALSNAKRGLDDATGMYKVQRGDTLYNISQKFDISVEELKLINKLKSDNIQIDQQLKVKKY